MNKNKISETIRNSEKDWNNTFSRWPFGEGGFYKPEQAITILNLKSFFRSQQLKLLRAVSNYYHNVGGMSGLLRDLSEAEEELKGGKE